MTEDRSKSKTSPSLADPRTVNARHDSSHVLE